MEDDWEQLADSPKTVVIPKPNPNKWEGEDEDDVKDSWEDEEDEEKKDEEKLDGTPTKTKSKKSLQQKIAEKERKKLEELEKKQREQEEADMTPEQRLAEKLRIQREQEENDLKLALETFGITDNTTGNVVGIDNRNPKTAEEFVEFGEAISKKVLQFRYAEEFPGFVEELVRSLCASLSSTSIRKVKTTIDNLYLEKQKLEKGDKPKKGKGKVKAKLRLEGDNSRLDDYTAQYDDYDEMDDFM